MAGNQDKPIKMQLPTKKVAAKILSSKGEIIKDGSLINNGKYSGSNVISFPITKNSQFAGSGANVTMTQPMFFSPLHTPQNWQIASKRKEIYQWNFISPCEVLQEDHTFFELNSYDFSCEDVIEDTLTGGLLYEGINTPPIMDSEGVFRKSPRFSRRHCVDKRHFSFTATGYWRSVKLSEEHHVFVLDGDLYRKSLKLESNRLDRQKRGIKPNGVKKVHIPDNLIKRIQAHEVKSNDYLLTPVPGLGIKKLNCELSWLVGFCVADGYIYNNKHYSVGFTGDKDEISLSICKKYLENNFNSIIAFKKHGEGKGARVSITTKEAFLFFSNFIKNKSINKKFSLEVFNLDKESRLNIIAGYLDGDGSFDKQTNNLVANCYSKDLSDQLFWLCLSCGIRCSLTKHPLYGDHYPTSSEFCWRLIIPAADTYIIKPYMQSRKIPADFVPPSCRELKFFYEEDGVKYFAQPIAKIEQFQYTGEGFDIEMPNKRKALVAGGYVCSNSRHYYENEPKVAAGIDFYSQFPINGFKLECKKKSVLKFFERLVEKTELMYWLRMISHQRFLLGDVYVMTEIECPHCKGSGVNKEDGEVCNHPDGTIGRLTVLNPDWIEVMKTPISQEPQIVLLPDEEIQKIIQTKQPKFLYDQIPDNIKLQILAKRPILLSNRVTSHIKHGGVPYGTYGESLLRRLFTSLAYKTKLMTANWIVAERLILPVRVVKVGSDERPADDDAIADVSSQLSAVANDPNLTIVTHNNFEYEWYGASGKIHNINQELEYVGKEILDGLMLNQTLLNGEMAGYNCNDQLTRTLTSDGFKYWYEIKEGDKIGCYNPKTKELEYHNYIAKHIYDYSGDMIQFSTDKIDICVTPNHRMYVQPRDSDKFEFIKAADVKRRAKTIGCVEGFKAEDQDGIVIGDDYYSMADFCEIAGFYISEGSTSKNYKNGKTSSLIISQSSSGKARKQISKLFDKVFSTHHETENDVIVYKPALSQYLSNNFGNHSYNKSIPSWMKNLPVKYLEILLDALIAGDGVISKLKNRKVKQKTYYTSSDKLCLDVAEIGFKCGYTTSISNKKIKGKICGKNKKGVDIVSRKDINIVYLSKGFKGKYPTIETKAQDNNGKEIKRVPYNGKVYCFTVPHGLFVTERNGKITIQGNSAQVGVEVMIRRLESWRNELAQWIEKNIFLPVAKMQGFIDEDLTKEFGETEYLYPRVKWDDLRLRDNTNQLQMYLQMQQSGLISAQTLLEEFDLDYDREVERIREEQVQAMQNGMLAGGGQQMGGAPGGLGGAPGGDPMGGMGGAPGMDMGGGMGGGVGGAPGMDMGGGMAGGAAGGGAGGGMGAAASGSTQKIYRKGKGPKDDDKDMQPVRPTTIQLTKPESKMYRTLTAMNIPFKLFAQYKQPVPNDSNFYLMDFAIPQLGIDLEVDGEKWHSSPEDKQKDKERDLVLASLGWRVLRFTEQAIGEQLGKVQQVIEKEIADAAREKKSLAKKAKAGIQAKYKVGQFSPFDGCYILKGYLLDNEVKEG